MDWGYSIPYMITGMLNEHPRSAIAVREGNLPTTTSRSTTRWSRRLVAAMPASRGLLHWLRMLYGLLVQLRRGGA